MRTYKILDDKTQIVLDTVQADSPNKAVLEYSKNQKRAIDWGYNSERGLVFILVRTAQMCRVMEAKDAN